MTHSSDSPSLKTAPRRSSCASVASPAFACYTAIPPDSGSSSLQRCDLVDARTSRNQVRAAVRAARGARPMPDDEASCSHEGVRRGLKTGQGGVHEVPVAVVGGRAHRHHEGPPPDPPSVDDPCRVPPHEGARTAGISARASCGPCDGAPRGPPACERACRALDRVSRGWDVPCEDRRHPRSPSRVEGPESGASTEICWVAVVGSDTSPTHTSSQYDADPRQVCHTGSVEPP